MDVTEILDPRIVRTRKLLIQALQKLLEERGFDGITMQEIAERSGINRGTIYAHYKDKFALLETLINDTFSTLMEARMEGATTSCAGGVRHLILAISDFFSSLSACGEKHNRPFEPVVEAAVRVVVRSYLLRGLQFEGKVLSPADAELRATAASWAICGTVLEWSKTRSIPAEQLADAVLPLVAPVLLLSKSNPSSDPV